MGNGSVEDTLIRSLPASGDDPTVAASFVVLVKELLNAMR
jgi:hypothetical protein